MKEEKETGKCGMLSLIGRREPNRRGKQKQRERKREKSQVNRRLKMFLEFGI